MTDLNHIKAANVVQHFWESGLLLVGFVALFCWEGGAVELKIALGIILVRACFSWGETSVLEKKIAAMALESQKQLAFLKGLLFELDRKIGESGPNAEHIDDAEESARVFLEKIRSAEHAFQESYERSVRMEGMFSSSVGSMVWTSITGAVMQVTVLGLVAWGMTGLLKSI